MDIYFAGSIRGGRGDAALYHRLIAHLSSHGTVLTEHVGAEDDAALNEEELCDRAIHDRDLEWLERSDVLIAEVSLPSHGVGYELGRAVALGKPILCLHREGSGGCPSAMIAGCAEMELATYSSADEAERRIDAFLERA